MFVIETEDDAKALAKLHATRKKEILFTTYTFSHKRAYSYEAINAAKHMWENLREIGLIPNTILLSYDLHSCQVLWEHGIPCFLDRYLRQPDDLPGQSCLVQPLLGCALIVVRENRQSEGPNSKLAPSAGQYGSEVPHWYQKYAWALKFIEYGYTTVFMELGKNSLFSFCFCCMKNMKE